VYTPTGIANLRKERTTMANTQGYGKTSLIDDITANTQGYTRKAVAEILDAALDTIQAKVASGQAVTLTGFGTFRQSQRAARNGTNIRTGQKIQIPASTSVRFTAGSDLKAAAKGGKAKERGR
jgi:nucleoid DNA-binding protein